MYESLKHNSKDSIIRRPNGLKDSEWNSLVVKVLQRLTVNPELVFLQELAHVAKKEKNEYLLDILGIEDTPYQNWSHASYRFFRHFCPENLRNALSHSGLPFATLEREEGDLKKFVWTSSVTLRVKNVEKIFAMHGIEIDDIVHISAIGQSDIEYIYIIVDGKKIIDYYEKGISKSFGDTMYFLKKAIIANRKEEPRNSIQKQRD
jgi:hypothetical protein